MLKMQKTGTDNLRKFCMDKVRATRLRSSRSIISAPIFISCVVCLRRKALRLAHSIKQYGLLQPITVRKLSHNYYEIIAGERRWRAVCKAGSRISRRSQPAIDEDSAVIALIENLQRETCISSRKPRATSA